MIGHYLRMATRNLRKHGFHTTVSLVSLTLGFLCYVAASVFADYLASWDRHYPDSEHIFTVNSSSQNPRTDGLPVVPRQLAGFLENDFPEIEYAATLRASSHDVTIGASTTRMLVQFVEGDYLKIFPLRMLPGSTIRDSELPPATALITESAALSRFGTTDVVGKRITVGPRIEVTVGGVVRKSSRPSHLQSILPGSRPDLILPLSVADSLRSTRAVRADAWADRSYRTYVKLAAGASLDPSSYLARLRAFSENHVPTTLTGSGPYRTLFTFHPLSEAAPSFFKLVFGGIAVTRLIGFAGLLVLLVACLNYSNLVIAQLVRRGHELAVQKVTGAKRRHLLAQHAVESSLVAGTALVAAVAVCALVIRSVPFLRGSGFHLGLLLTPRMWFVALAGLVAVISIASVFPMLRITRRPLVGLLHGTSATSYSSKLRALMVGTQFALASAFLILALVILRQNETILLQAQAGSPEHVIVLRDLVPESDDELDLLEARLRRSAAIEATSRNKFVPWALNAASEGIPLWRDPNPQSPFVALSRVAIGYGFFETMQIPLVAGRTFSKEYASDLYPPPSEIRRAQGPYSVVIDAATAKRLGFASPEQAVGQALYTSYLPPIVDEPRFMPLTVVGVVADRTLEIAAIGITPTHAFMLSPPEGRNIIVRANAQRTREALADIDAVWQELYPRSHPAPEFLDDVFADNYRVFRAIGYVLSSLALFTVAIAATGLVGMATFVARSRLREVVIRRVHGAGQRRVLRMLLTDFSRPVLVANLIAWPIGFALASLYLRLFYVRTPVTLGPFLQSLLLCLAVAVIAIIHQAWQAARLRPAEVLKHE